MKFTMHELYNELYNGYMYALMNMSSQINHDRASRIANKFAVKNTWHLFHYKNPIDAFKFTDHDVKQAFCISGYIRLWLCYCTDDSLVFGYDAGNGHYIKINIKS